MAAAAPPVLPAAGAAQPAPEPVLDSKSGGVPYRAARTDDAPSSGAASSDTTPPAPGPSPILTQPVTDPAAAPLVQALPTASAPGVDPNRLAIPGNVSLANGATRTAGVVTRLPDAAAQPLPHALPADAEAAQPGQPRAPHVADIAGEVAPTQASAPGAAVAPAAATTGGVTAPAPAPPTQPAAPAPAASPLPQHPSARLADLPDVAQTTIQVAAREGVSTARIVLSPPELGHVEIRLHYGEGGVTASVVADRPEAAQALAQTTGELRRALESQGLTVHGLDITHAGPDPDRGSQRDPATPQPGRRLQDPEDEAGEVSIDASTLPLADSQVDVLA